MKNNAKERKKMTELISENENSNLRIKALLAEMANYKEVENVRPYSPMQQEILKVYEEGVLNSDIEINEDIIKISKTAQPSSPDLRRYKLWLEQKYCSPYTGEIIPLNKLFTHEYEIEHIIPQSRYFDDSISNKVICEAAVNKLKDNHIGLAFIKQFHGQVVECGFGKKVKILGINEYEQFVKQHYAKNRTKRNKLLMEDIPEKMIERQLNDTRYISKFISSLLSNIVRSEANDDGINSKNLIQVNGKITSDLKQDWGLNDVWNEIILPRFNRLNQLTNSTHFTSWNENHKKFLPTIPIELSKGFSKKRIDHRHHAMDALIIACATRDHVNLMNNKHAKSKERFDLNRKLREYEKVSYSHPLTSEQIEKEVPKNFLKPWSSFTVDTRRSLENIVVSFKQNLRIINKATNYYEKIENGKKIMIEQKGPNEQKAPNWAIRKSMHEETVSGLVELPWLKKNKGELVTANRKTLDKSFNEEKIRKITDTGIQKILINYLKSANMNAEEAFSPEGIEYLNKNITLFNDGKFHQPVLKARIYEKGKGRFILGEFGNKKRKYVQGAPNLFFAIYEDENHKRTFETIPLNIVIERLKQGLSQVPEVNEDGFNLSQKCPFLSPNDLVYVPTEEERENFSSIDLSKLNSKQLTRIYKVVSFSDKELLCLRSEIAHYILPYNRKLKNKGEVGWDNKSATTMEGDVTIKEFCIKLKVDRLGNISVS